METIKSTIEALGQTFHTRMQSFEAELKSRESGSRTDSLATLTADFHQFREFMMSSVMGLQKQLDVLAAESDALETRSRRNILLLHGVSETREADAVSDVVSVARDMLSLSNIAATDIDRAHRMGTTSSDKPRPILVKFIRATVRDEVWGAKSVLKGSGVTVSEFLTRSRYSLFNATRERLGFRNCWTREGRIFAVDGQGERRTITSRAELDKLVSAISSVPPSAGPGPAGAASNAASVRSERKEPKRLPRSAAVGKKAK